MIRSIATRLNAPRPAVVTLASFQDPLVDVVDWTAKQARRRTQRSHPVFGVIAIPAAIAFCVAMGIGLFSKPLPNMHDDFGNLLVADTLLHGRFTNPTPPAAESLETFHTILYPSYASKYPIGTGAFLAVGKLLGNEAIGLWLMAGMAAGAIAWMMLGWLSVRWSLFAGLTTALHPYWQNGWSQEFTPGWLAVIGMALVVGGIIRLRPDAMQPYGMRKQTWSYAALIAIGCVMVLFSRPFEGGVLCLLIAIPLLTMIAKQGWYRSPSFWRAALPGILILASGIGLQLYINRQVTGSYAMLPYQLHEAQYGVAPLFRWQSPHEPSLGHRYAEQIEFHRKWSLESVQRAESWIGYCALLSDRLAWIRINWGTMFFVFPATIAFWPRERKRIGWFLLIAMLALLVYNCVPWIMPHYASPLVPIAIALSMIAMRRLVRKLYQWRSAIESETDSSIQRVKNKNYNSRNKFRKFELAAMGLVLVMQSISLVATTASIHRVSADDRLPWAVRRDQMIARLEESSERDLVLVRYEPGHDVMQEWVFNGADPESQSILWGRWGDEPANQTLLQSYPRRRVWILDVDRDNRELLRRWPASEH